MIPINNYISIHFNWRSDITLKKTINVSLNRR